MAEYRTLRYRIAGAGRDGRDLVTHDSNKAHDYDRRGHAVAQAEFDEYGTAFQVRSRYQRTHWTPITWRERAEQRYYLIKPQLKGPWTYTYNPADARAAYERGQLIITTDAVVTCDHGVIEKHNRRDQKPERARRERVEVGV